MRQPPVDHIERTRALYSSLGYAPYRWVASDDDVPLVPLPKPLPECRVALLASGGIYRRGQIAFHHLDDTSYRVIPTDTPTEDLRATHFAYDLTDARRDPNVVFPVDTLRSLAAAGEIGGLGPRAYTFMGGIYSSRRVREELTPRLVEAVLSDPVDVALLVPVWPVCHQTVGLIARALEAAGIPTTTLSSCRTITASVRPPRAAFVDFPLGHTSGRPCAPEEQRSIVRSALALLAAAPAPGLIVDLPVAWDDDDGWKDSVLRPSGGGNGGDQRSERRGEPVWQCDDDRVAAARAHRHGPCGECLGAE